MLSVAKPVTKPQVTARECSLHLLVKTEPWLRVFLRNLGDLFRHKPPQLWLTARSAQYWPDALVHRPVAWDRIRQSFLGHVLVVLSVYWITLLWLDRPQVVVEELPRTTITHYELSDYVPPVSARREAPAPPARESAQKADPELAKQEIVSIHAEHSSLKQTVVHPSPRLLPQDTVLPNIIAWTAIPGAPPVATTSRPLQDLPSQDAKVVSAEPLPQRSHIIFPAALQVVPPPEPISANHSAPIIPPAAPEVVEPASTIAARDRLSLPLPVAVPQVVTPTEPVSPRPLTNQIARAAPQAVVPPPQPVVTGKQMQSRFVGQLLALNARPVAPVGPLSVPEGNRRGEFAASPSGRPEATARPEITAARAGGSNPGNDSAPANLYVSAPPVKTTADTVVAAPHPFPAVRALVPGRADTPGDRIDAEIFGARRRYSIRLSMPNLNSAIGSWIMRYARLNSAPGADEDVTPPEPLHKVDPGYPASYVHDRIEGVVVLYGVIHADGSVGNVRVLEGFDSVLDESARVALGQWRFRPGTRNGIPVDVEVVVRVPFRAPKAPF